MQPDFLSLAWIFFIFGLAIGSFLNVLIDRLPYAQGILGRSRCDYCKKTLKWYDLVPVFSYLFLKGRCRYCGKKISLYYPLVELLTAALFSLIYLRFFTLPLFKIFLLYGIVALFIVIFFSDIKYMIIPDEVQVALIILSFLYKVNCQGFCLMGIFDTFFRSFIAGFVVMFPMLFLFYFTKEKGIGFGDVKLAFNIGFLFGILKGLLVLYFSFLLGGLISIFLLILKRKGLKSQIPFAPFLVISSLLFIFFPEQVLRIIKSVFRFF